MYLNNSLKKFSMRSHHSDEDNRDFVMHDIAQQDEDERPTMNANIRENTINTSSDDKPYSSDSVDDDDDDDDEVWQRSSCDNIDQVLESSLPSVKQISVALALFRHRYKLSKTCINDLCDLLRSLGVINVSADFRAIERNIMQKHENVLKINKYFICSVCGNKGAISSKCENIQCESYVKFNETPTTLCSFKLLPQITSILERHELSSEEHDNNHWTTDIRNAQVRRNIVYKERTLVPEKKIVTLLLNSDGVVLKKFSRSLWVTCMVIKELPRSVRYNTNNIIICSISAGPTKPKKNQFQSFIYDWVYELKQLELGFYISFPGSNGDLTKVHAYLIAASMDKPAQALLCYINDPIGFYSCIRCTIRGKST